MHLPSLKGYRNKRVKLGRNTRKQTWENRKKRRKSFLVTVDPYLWKPSKNVNDE